MAQVTHWAPFKAGAAIGARKICQIAADGDAVQAVAATKGLVGVSGSRGVANGETVEVAVTGIAEVVLGGTVEEGAFVTADANGDAVATTTASDGIVGICVKGGVDNDIGEVLLAQGSV